MNFARAMLVVALLAFSIQAQNYTVEFERVIEGAENFSRIEPVVDPNFGLTFITTIHTDDLNLNVYDFTADTLGVLEVSGNPKAILSVSDSAGGLRSIYVVHTYYGLGTGLFIGRFWSDQGTPNYFEIETVCHGCFWGWAPVTPSATLDPILVDGQMTGVRIGAHYEFYLYDPQYGDYGQNGSDYHMILDYPLDLSEEERASYGTYMTQGNVRGDSELESCTYTHHYSQWTDYFCNEPYCPTDVQQYSSLSIAGVGSITTDKGAYGRLWIENFDKSTPYDEILYQGVVTPIDKIGGKSNHIALFRGDNGYPERVWLIPTTINVDYYYEPENLIVGISYNGLVSFLNAGNGEITQQIQLGRKLTASQFFTNPVTKTLGLVGRVHDTIFVYNFGSPTPVEEPVKTLPTNFTLAQNYPNPFNPSTTISFFLDQPGSVELSIYNVTGQKVATLENRFMSSGEHHVKWNGTDRNNQPVASGVYLYRLKTASHNQTRKMLLIK